MENEKEIDDQVRNMDSQEIQCEREHIFVQTLNIFLSGKTVMEPHNLTHFPRQTWSKETKSSRFEESDGDSTNDQDSEKDAGDVEHEHKSW